MMDEPTRDQECPRGDDDGNMPGPGIARADGGSSQRLRRRTILKTLAALGAGTATFRRAVAAQAALAGEVTPEMIKQAEWIAGLELSDKERESAAKQVRESLEAFQALRKTMLSHDVP